MIRPRFAVPLAILLPLILAACGGAPSAPPKPRPSGTVDGLYRGTSTRFMANDRSCPHPGLVRLQVANGAFRYRLSGPVWVEGTVDPDGPVRGDGGGFTVTGDWDGNKIEGDAVSLSCALHFRAVKAGT